MRCWQTSKGLPPICYNTKEHTPHRPMTRDLATALLNRAADGAQLLAILDTITADVETQGIEDAAAHYQMISALTAEPIQF